MSLVNSAIVLAGGLGTRLRPLVSDVPKPMAPVAGRPFLEYLLEHWIQQGIRRFVLSVGYEHEKISNHFGNDFLGARVEYAVEEHALGTGGALFLAADRISEAECFLVLNGDTYFAVDLAQLHGFATGKDADWCFSLFPTTDVERYMPLDVQSDGRISSLGQSADSGLLANGGVYWVHSRALRGLRPSHGTSASLETDIFPSALRQRQRLFGLRFPGAFIDIGLPNDFLRAPKVLASNRLSNNAITR